MEFEKVDTSDRLVPLLYIIRGFRAFVVKLLVHGVAVEYSLHIVNAQTVNDERRCVHLLEITNGAGVHSSNPLRRMREN